MRHGGHRSHVWRVMATGSKRMMAREYGKVHAKMRRGGLRLVAPDGRIAMSALLVSWLP